jgi:hypothetical protein
VFQRLGNQQPQQQDAKSAAMAKMKELGFSIPEGKENDPNYLIQMVMQSGKFPQNRLGMAQQVMQRMFGRR